MSEVAQVWGARIDWQQRSGLTVAERCEAEGVSTASFYRWKKLLAEGRHLVHGEQRDARLVRHQLRSRGGLSSCRSNCENPRRLWTRGAPQQVSTAAACELNFPTVS